jgi:hypothetical protein
MWNEPTKDRLDRVPRLYETEHIPLKEKYVHIHFFIGGCDWYVIEYDGTDIFWGYAILNGDYLNSELGYFSLSELKAIKINGWLEVDCELEEYWNVRPLSEIDKINKARNWAKQGGECYV